MGGWWLRVAVVEAGWLFKERRGGCTPRALKGCFIPEGSPVWWASPLAASAAPGL